MPYCHFVLSFSRKKQFLTASITTHEPFPSSFALHVRCLKNVSNEDNHRLNLIVNDLNSVTQVRNMIGTVKSVIKFFRKKNFGHPKFPIQDFFETRQTARYKTIRVFYSNLEVVKAVDKFSVSSSCHVRQEADHLHTAITSSVSIVSLAIILKYSTVLEPICQMLQSPTTDILQVQKHTAFLLNMFDNHRKNAEKKFRDNFIEHHVSTDIVISLSKPKLLQAKKMKNIQMEH